MGNPVKSDLTIDESVAVTGGKLRIRFTIPNGSEALRSKIMEFLIAHTKDFSLEKRTALEKTLCLNFEGISGFHVDFIPDTASVADSK